MEIDDIQLIFQVDKQSARVQKLRLNNKEHTRIIKKKTGFKYNSDREVIRQLNSKQRAEKKQEEQKKA